MQYIVTQCKDTLKGHEVYLRIIKNYLTYMCEYLREEGMKSAVQSNFLLVTHTGVLTKYQT